MNVPQGTAERFFRPGRDFGNLRDTSPSHEWLGYYQENGGGSAHSECRRGNLSRRLAL